MVPTAPHTCQWENSPSGMANRPVQFISAPKRQKASAKAIRAAGVSSADRASAARRLAFLFCLSLGPCPSRMRSSIAGSVQSTSNCDTVWKGRSQSRKEANQIMRRIKTAVIGAGFMGRVHAEAIRRLGNVDIVAVAAISAEEAARFGQSIGVERTTADYMSIVSDPGIEALHICTPNA